MVQLTRELHPFLTEAVLESFNKKLIFTTLDLVNADNKVLEKLCCLTIPELQQLKRHFVKRLSVKPVNASDCYKDIISNSAIYKTGIQSFDDMLKGGILTGNILEISGLPACGKTTFCIKFIQRSMQTGCTIYVVDTKNDMSPKTIMNTIDIPRQDMVPFMENIFISRILNKYEFIQSLFEVKKMIEKGKQIRILIVDSLASLFLDSKNTKENNNLLNIIANLLRFFVNEHHLAVVVTNLITEWRDETSYRQTVMSGKFWSTVPNIKVKLEKSNGNVKVTLLKNDNSYNAINQTCFYNWNQS